MFNEIGEYAFVVGMQFDTTSLDASAEKLQLMDTFLALIPGTVIGTTGVVSPQCIMEVKTPIKVLTRVRSCIIDMKKLI